MSSLALLPSTRIKPRGAERSVVRRELVRNAFNRRTFIKAIFVMAGATVLLSVEGGLRKIKAFADTAPTLTSCADYKAAQTSLYGSAYASGPGRWWSVCNPHANDVGGGEIGWDQISNEFCNSDGYHRKDYVNGSGGWDFNYNRRASSCAGVNAWAWKVDLDTTWQNKHSRRCSDGQRVQLHDGVEVDRINTACKDMLGGHDPAVGSLPFNQFTPDGCSPDATSPTGC
jgi:hypothetical protein